MAKNPNQVVLQSFVRTRITVNFRDEKGVAITSGGIVKTITIPSWMEQPKNIQVMSKDDFKQIKQDLEVYLTLGQNKGIVVLDDIPEGYWDPAQRVAAAEAKVTAAQGERDGAVKRAETAEAEIERLKTILMRTYGWSPE